MISNWFSRCWGGMGVATRFEKARINCSIADWTVPYEDDILILITSFQDKNPEIPAKSAINSFLSHLETDDQKTHPAFLLKHLYVLDHCVEQMTILDTIGYYYNSSLAAASKSSKKIDNSDVHMPLRQLISSYYSYLILKARNYGRYENSYFSKDLQPMKAFGVESKFVGQSRTVDDQVVPSEMSLQNSAAMNSMYNSAKKKKTRQCTREQRSIQSLFEKQTSYLSIFQVIDKCQQIQAYIISINNIYAQGNRKAELIKFIFIMLLRTYIRCYVIVSVGIKFLFKSFMSMSIKELDKFIKTFQNFNNHYTQNFISFVQSNRQDIDIFKEINYTELTYLKKDGMKVLTDYRDELKQNEEYLKLHPLGGSSKSFEQIKPVNLSVLPTNQYQEMAVVELPLSIQTKIQENMKIFYKPRKNMDFYLLGKKNRRINDPEKYIDDFEEQTEDSSFFTYSNNYHELFSTPFDDIVDGNMTTSKKSQPSNSTLAPPNSMNRIKSHDVNKDSSSKVNIQKAGHKSGINFRENQIERLNNEENENKKLSKSQILNGSSQKRQDRQRRQIRKGGIQLKKKQSSSVNETWQDWQNVYADNGTVMTKH